MKPLYFIAEYHEVSAYIAEDSTKEAEPQFVTGIKVNSLAKHSQKQYQA